MENLIMKEYEHLRDEIGQKISLHNNLMTFSITTTVALITLAAAQENSIFFLLPFFIIIPLSMRIAYYRKAIAKISAYMIVFLEPKLEGISWETRNHDFSTKNVEKPQKMKLGNYECLFLSIACYVVFLVKHTLCGTTNITFFVVFILSTILLVWEVVITCKINDFDSYRDKMVGKWNTILQNEAIPAQMKEVSN